MAGKPFALADLFQQGLPKKHPPKGIYVQNRFDVLRDRSSSVASARCESPGKRPREASGERVDRNLVFKSMAGEEEKLAKAKLIVGNIKEMMKTAKEKGAVGPMWDIVNGILEWMDITTGVQETTANVVVDSFNKVASPRKSRKTSPERVVLSAEEEEKSRKRKKFAQEVKEAERSTLIFKTNMGNVAVMNPDTMRKRFSMDLAEKAAKVEGTPGTLPTANFAAQLVDALAMVTRMEYFGKVTKKQRRWAVLTS